MRSKKPYSMYELTNRMCLIPSSAFQSFLSVLTQMAPFEATFG